MFLPTSSSMSTNGYEVLVDKERRLAIDKIYSLICILYRRKFNSVQFLKLLINTQELHDLFVICIGASTFREAISWYVRNIVDLKSQTNPKNILED